MPLSVALITLNEEQNIRACLETVSWADEIVVVDGESSDATACIAEEMGARVIISKFENFAAQKNIAIRACKHDWIFMIDADERMKEESVAEIRSIVEANQKDAIYSIGRETYFFGKLLRYSGNQYDAPIRLIPRNEAEMKKPVHEEVSSKLPVKKLQHKLIHYSTRDPKHYQQKLDCYLPFELEQLREKNKSKNVLDMVIRPIGRFFQIYIRQAGILDGWPGFQFSVFSSYYVWLKYKRYIFN